ncbi:hypothetical protein PQQ99_19210 [Paraburkholderia sediminicola]|uniref:hypothetical protein n=1 Tax=Paraburkholderia sediminicola TaxID=458836 RepID=UPI0038B6D7EE
MNSNAYTGSPKRPLRLRAFTPLVISACFAGAPFATATAAAASPVLQFADSGFEQAGPGYACSSWWVVSSGAGCASNNPHSGTHAVFLNQGDGYSVSQSVQAPVGGSFDFSAWITASTGGTGGTFSIRSGNGPEQKITLPASVATSQYIKYTLPRIVVAAGDTVTITFASSSGRAWVNVDDIEVVPSAPNDPQISSSNQTVVAMFNWAKVKANSWVRETGATGVVNMDENNRSGSGTGVYTPTYWAGYPFRSYYYSRDFAHQFLGAHMLGLDLQNKTMLEAFAASATQNRGYFPLWAINFDGSTGTTDYKSDSNFVRELPAPFDLTQRIHDGYRWTGDIDYVNDPALTSFVANTVSAFVADHTGLIPDGRVNGRQITLAQASGNNIFQGVASYNESAGDDPVEAADAVSTQYQAYLAMSALSAARRDVVSARTYAQKAADLFTYYNRTWSVGPGSYANVIRSYNLQSVGSSAWGAEMSWFAPMKGIMEAGGRRDQYMSWLNATALTSTPPNLEAVTYLPDAFFTVHDGTTAWAWMQYVYNRINDLHSGGFLNGDYPETSFTLVSQVVQGLLGIQPDAAIHDVTTVSQLPSDIGWLQVAGIPIGGGTITLRHDGRTQSTLTNSSPANAAPYIWHAGVPGAYLCMTVRGQRREGRIAQPEGPRGPTFTYADLTVQPGQTVVVQAPSNCLVRAGSGQASDTSAQSQ